MIGRNFSRIGDGVIGVASIGDPSVEYSETTSGTGVVGGSDLSLFGINFSMSWQQVSVSRPGQGKNPTCLIVGARWQQPTYRG